MMIKSYNSTIISKVHAIMTGDAQRGNSRFLETLLEGVSYLYGMGVRLRCTAYRRGHLRARRLPCCVVSLGNITVGGTGKTPMALYVAGLIQRLGYRVALVSRGYGGGFEEKGGIVSDGETILCSPKEAGDEPYMVAGLLNSPVVVGKNRFIAGQTALRRFSPDVIVLDDGFQHMALDRDLDFLLMDAQKPFGNGHLLPRGVLREPEVAALRAHAVIFTRSDRAVRPDFGCLSQAAQSTGGPFFNTIHTPVFMDPLKGDGPSAPDGAASRIMETVKGKRVFLFSGIADNLDFRKMWEKMGLKITGHLEFPDHYWYEQHDIDVILAAFKKASGDLLITTEKDYVKIQNRFPQDLPLIVAGVRIRFEQDQEALFEQFVKNRIDDYFKGQSWGALTR